MAYALTWDIDTLFSNAGIGEAGPVFEIPMELVRHNFDTNVFAPLSPAQQFIKKFIDGNKKGKIVFTSCRGGLSTPAGYGIEAMIHIIPAETGKFRNVVPQAIEDMLKESQTNGWENII